MGGIVKALLLLLILSHFNTRFSFKLNKKSERLDDIDLKPLTSRNERRKMHYSSENMEGRSNISLAQEGEVQHNENKLNGIKGHLGDTKLPAVSEKIHLLSKRSHAERKQNLKVGRGVSQRDVLGSLNNNSETLTRNTFAFFEDLRETNKALRETNEGLRATNKIMKEMYENTSNALLHVLESITKIISTELGTAINKTMAAYSLELRQEIKKIPCQISQPKSCLELLNCNYTESDVYSVFLGDHEIKIVKLKPLTSRNERRKMHYSLEKMEGRSNISLAEEGSSGGEIQHDENKLNGIKEHLADTKLAAISEKIQLLRKRSNADEKIQLLRKRSNAEKKQNLRFDRGVSQRDVLGLLNNNSETLTRNTFAFFEDLRETNQALRETNEGLRETNKIMKEMYENTSNALLHVLESMTKNISTALGTAINKTMAAYSLELRQEMKKIPCLVSQPKSCLELLKGGYLESGVNFVCLGDHAIKVYCDQTTDGGGWTVFQRRQDGSVDFYLGWEKYRNGFGDLHGEFWLGNDKLHRLLSVKSGYELRVDLADFDGNTAYAKYSRFMVGPENDNYVLTAEGYSGDAGDSLDYHNGYKFSTKDRDNDIWSVSCSQSFKGGWWYHHCYNSNLNGLYRTDKQRKDGKNVLWQHWKDYYPLKFSEMKFRELIKN